ncbi:MAG: DUF2703 domain-containing protein [Elusimicrobia bacterium]|nr:DUF2703 domain-containing protein [Elusimicrobiota bacterium]
MAKILKIRWQRLVDEHGRTCQRCGSTGGEVRAAVRTLARSLKPLGIAVRADARPLSSKTFKNDPSASNRIWVAGRPLEDWLGARVGRSPCCGACGTSECRTLSIGASEHEVIPARIIISAGLLAASRMLLAANR